MFILITIISLITIKTLNRKEDWLLWSRIH
jgi:hypothetical protein